MTEHAERNSKPHWALLAIASIMLIQTRPVEAQGTMFFSNLGEAPLGSDGEEAGIASRSVTAMGPQSSFPGRAELDPTLFTGSD